jgi:bifunctional enzyme CysN/CysC
VRSDAARVEDVMAEIAATRVSERGDGGPALDLAAITDGLRAEREQGITIDVAYRFFATPRRSFIIADTPGHERYTRNMVTGASTAELALILIDARNGILAQSRRHTALSALLGIRHLVACVNKMDLVDWDEERFRTIEDEFRALAERLDVPDATAIPIAALHGDNVVERSVASPWYQGPPLLERLETVEVLPPPEHDALRLPVQWVIRPAEQGGRLYAGQMAAGVLRPGDEVTVLPRGARTRVAAVETFDGPLEEAVRRSPWPSGSPTTSTSAAGTSSARPTARRSRRARSRRRSAGWATRRCGPAPATRSSTPPAASARPCSR